MKTSFRVQSVFNFHHGKYVKKHYKKKEDIYSRVSVIEKNRNNRKVSEYHAYRQPFSSWRF
jgi:hypothetical protein